MDIVDTIASMVVVLPILHFINILLFFAYTCDFSKVKIPLLVFFSLTALFSAIGAIFLSVQQTHRMSSGEITQLIATGILTLSAVSAVWYIILLHRNWCNMSPVSQVRAFRIYALIGMTCIATIVIAIILSEEKVEV